MFLWHIRAMSEPAGGFAEHVALFALWTCGVTLVFAIVALASAWAMCRRGWLDIAPGGPRWFRAMALLLASLAGIAFGGFAGVQVGGVKAGLSLLSAHGPSLLKTGLARACESLGLAGVDREMSIGKVRDAVEAIEGIRLVESRGVTGAIVNTAFDLVRRPFVARAERFLSRHAPGDRISINRLVDATWSDVEKRLDRWGNALVVSALLESGFLLACLGAAAPGLAWIVRRAIPT